jgi:uncharacterized Ntn-hydrolase superfamily protein
MRKLILISPLLFILSILQAQDTFSIVAVDTITGEIGSAGASCLDNIQFPGSNGAIIISDILPGRGAIHTQSYWNATNQNNARLKMEEGLSPTEILDFLKNNDPTGLIGAQTRQYGIVDFDPDGHPRSASFTGTQCLDWKGHHTGVNYAIQGNILLGPQIIDSIESRFINATGTLADRLMAALQGANVVGADSRCTDNGTSSLSAFLRVAKPNDDDNNLYLDLNVPSLPAGMEPIDSLQSLYDQWLTTSAVEPTQYKVSIFPNPASQSVTIYSPQAGMVRIFTATGQLVFTKKIQQGNNQLSPALHTGLYFIQTQLKDGSSGHSRLIWQE